MIRKPTLEEICKYLDSLNPLGLKGATINTVSERNHLIYRLEKEGRLYALRMINPESYRKGEWISMAEEYQILKALEPTGLGPEVYYLDEKFSPPFLIQEFVETMCFNDLKPLSEMHLKAAARAIAVLNSQGPTPERLPFLEKYREESYERRTLLYRLRLLDSIRRRPFRKDVWGWAVKIMPLLRKTQRILSQYEPPLDFDWSFHFDGAHCGNTYWQGEPDGRVIFLDWQKVSWRNDPTFTLVRFATSIGDKGIVPDDKFRTLIKAYLETSRIPYLYFYEMAKTRLLERQVSDLVWVLWDHTRRRDRRPVEAGTSVVPRFEEVKRMLQKY